MAGATAIGMRAIIDIRNVEMKAAMHVDAIKLLRNSAWQDE
jgi:hypothetical protein